MDSQRRIQPRGVHIPISYTSNQILFYHSEKFPVFRHIRTEGVDLTIQWMSRSNFMPWREIEGEVKAPYETPVTTGDTTSPSLRQWSRTRIEIQILAGNISHSWGYYTFNHTVAVTGSPLPPEGLPRTPPVEVGPFRWEFDHAQETIHRAGEPEEMEERAVRCFDSFYGDGYPLLTRSKYRYDRLVFPSKSTFFNLYPDSSSETEGGTIILEINPVFASAERTWWPLQGEVLKLYATPVNERTFWLEEINTPTMRDWIHDRIGGSRPPKSANIPRLANVGGTFRVSYSPLICGGV